MNTFVLLLLAIVAASATATSLRKQVQTVIKNVKEAEMELKRFDEQIRAKKFDKDTGKRLHAMQAGKVKNPFAVMDGTTFDAEGNPLISQRVVALDTPTKFATGYGSITGATSCGDSDLLIVYSAGLDVCFIVSTYDHAAQTTTSSSTKTTYTGTGPWTITITDYTDTACATSPTTSTVTLETSCELGGFGNFPSNYGYGTVGSSVITSPPSADGLMTLNYATSSCGTVLGSEWNSVTAFTGSTSKTFGDCISGSTSYVYSCDGGDLTASVYSDSSCSTLFLSNVAVVTKGDCTQTEVDDDASTGDDDISEDAAYTSGYCTVESSSESSTCFAGSEMVTLESGASKLIADVVVGDRVLAANAQGAFVFSDVIAVPHAKNNDRVMFNEISLANGADIRMTGEHLLPVAASCGVDAVFAVIAAKDVAANSCVMTVNGQSAVVSNNKVAGAGIYTIVTNEEYVVVNGVVASPFATSHAMGNTFYNVYRAMYNYVPGLFKSSLFQTFHATFAHLAMKTW